MLAGGHTYILTGNQSYMHTYMHTNIYTCIHVWGIHADIQAAIYICTYMRI